ncbi:MAG: hscC [Armatimonadetes bacterium]|jgi:molecular chaperone DnaK (HSP70)|nr:hscC [Armatimonadota bacterium]
MKTVYTIGIDFGTSNSCVTYATYLDRGNGEVEPEPLHRPEAIAFNHRDTLPTAIFLGDGAELQPTFGEPAEERAPFYPELTRSGFKLRLAHPEHGREAFLLAKQFFQYLRKRTAEVVPLDRKDSAVRFETVVGHPVQWSADQRDATRRAALEAGFPNVRLEEESMAALYSHLCDDPSGKRPKAGSRILMVDMGGGTTDFAFLQLAMSEDQRPVSIPVDPAPSVPAWGGGRRSYGGRDLDQLLLDYLTRDWDPEVVKKGRQALLREVRRFKEAFSVRLRDGANAHESLWLVGDEARDVRLTRAEFERIAAEYMAHFQVLLRGALAEAKVAPRQVTHLILTGGHSRWYFVDNTLREVFPHLSQANGTIMRHPHPEQSVARGLAYDSLVRSNSGGIMAPVRRAAHALWVSVPNGSLTGTGGASSGAWDEPILLLPRGQQLPFQTRTPLKIRVEQLGLDAREACVRIRFFSGQRKTALTERVARFERGTWEQVTRAVSLCLPWARSTVTPDQFEVLVACQVDEHELITAEVLVTRFVRGKAQEVQRQKMQLSSAAA